MAINRAFSLIPWCRDFLPQLAELVRQHTGDQPGKALVVFPHDRPKRYLVEAFRAQRTQAGATASLLPRMLSVRELFVQARASVAGGPMPQPVNRLDQVALLYDVCRGIAAQDTSSPLYARLTEHGAAGFFPWGEKLADLLEECLSQGIEPHDLNHAQDDVSPFAAALLASLGTIFLAYTQAMQAKNLSSPGLDAFWLARNLPLLETSPLFAGRSLFLAGFNALNGTEERIFRHLWSMGAQVVLHSDHKLATGQAHWCCAAQAVWVGKWQAGLDTVCPPSGIKPVIHYFAGHDTHSQLEALAQDISAAPGSGLNAKAVALTHPELLLPVLHQLPEKDCNISLGYPLQRTLLYRLLDVCLRAAEQRDAKGRIPWRLLAEISRHPWLCQLQAEGHSLHQILWQMEKLVLQGSPWQDANALAEQSLALAEAPPPVQALFRKLMDTLLRAFSAAESLGAMAENLARLCELLVQHGHTVWQRFVLDAECLYRLAAHTVPQLQDNSLAVEPLPMGLRHAMLQSVLGSERVPFEADPITGLQILGMLETRLLHFKHVFVPDATDDHLPGPPKHDQLLPDSLRGLFGLPDSQHREELAAHTFFGLLAGAEQVYLYWQEGVEAKGLFDAKKERSRFIEALIWAEEQEQQRLFTGRDSPVRGAHMRLSPPVAAQRHIHKSPAQQKALDDFLRKPLSASSLDAYTRCPLSFYYQYLAGLREPDSVREGDDPPAVGELVHKVLYETYLPLKGKTLSAGHMEASALERLFLQHLRAGTLGGDLPPESALMLEVAGLERLRRYLAAQGPLSVLHLEETFTASLWPGSPYSLQGRLDRVDIRAGGHCVVDYKTGRLHAASSALWHNQDLWALCAASMAEPASLSGFTEAVHAALPSLQLAVYVHLYYQSSGEMPANALWIDLGGNGTETALFAETVSQQERCEAITRHLPLLFEAIIHHMRHFPDFQPQQGPQCRWCTHKALCTI